MTRLIIPPHFFLHAIACLLAISVVGVFAGTLPATVETPEIRPTVNIGIEHGSPLTLGMEMSIQETAGIFDLTNKGDETVNISLPSSWQRREVRNVPIDTVTQDEPTFGFTRWHVSSGASVSFSVPEAPPGLTFVNPTKVPLKIEWKKIDVVNGSVKQDVILVQDQTTRRWE